MSKPTLVQAKFGQHDDAIAALRKQIENTVAWRDQTLKQVESARDHLRNQETNLATYNDQIDGYRAAIRALGGKS